MSDVTGHKKDLRFKFQLVLVSYKRVFSFNLRWMKYNIFSFNLEPMFSLSGMGLSVSMSV